MPSGLFPGGALCKKATRGCPCGYRGDPLRECRCTPLQIARYEARLSGPLRDRLDLMVDVPAVPADTLGTSTPGEPTAVVRTRVVAARDRQRERRAGAPMLANAELTPPLLTRYCALDSRSARLLTTAAVRLGISARGYDRLRRVARTIADLDGADGIRAEHVAEALQFRGLG